MKAGRIAIWNKNKVVSAIALGMGVTNMAFFVQGKCGLLSSPLYTGNLEPHKHGPELGIVRVSY